MNQYRLLEKGERIEATDEFLLDDCINWGAPDGWAIGMLYNPGFFVPARRPLATSNPANTPV